MISDREALRKAIEKIDAHSNVVYVYETEANTCSCCGEYTSPAIPLTRTDKAFRDSATKDHVVNQEVVNTIANLFKSHADEVYLMPGWPSDDDTTFCLDLGQRVYSLVTNFPTKQGKLPVWITS